MQSRFELTGARAARHAAVTVLILAGVMTPALAARLEPLPQFPLPVEESRSTTARQLAKPVFQSRLLDSFDTTNAVKFFGPGQMSLSQSPSRDGRGVITLRAPTKTPKPGPVQGRPFAEAGIRREFSNENWSAYNRLSVWVYPDLPGFKVISLLVKLRSEGTEGHSYTDGGLHFVLLENKRWNHVVWEIAHLDRQQVSGVELSYRLQGNEPGATEEVTYHFDQLELERVAADEFEGWTPVPGRIAYRHTGYERPSPKVAIARLTDVQRFSIVDATSSRRVWEGPVRAEPNTEIATLDFSKFTRRGSYRLEYGGAGTEPFTIGENALREPLIAALNFFYCERCGDTVPGVHDVCHQDWRVEHRGQTLVINGGWHDAGDLSQGLANTSEAVWSMLRLADRARKSDPALGERLREEARWGAQWLLKTRFGDGFRVNWATMDFWTDNKIGGPDDVTVRAGNSAFENYLAAAAEASAARALRESDSGLAAQLLLAAEQDFGFASASSREPNLEIAAAATQAAIELWRATRSSRYQDESRRFARIILSSQETTFPAWERPLRGFFYASPRRERLLHYNHRSHEQAPIVALVDLCREWPTDKETADWKNAVRLYGGYLTATATNTAPYHMFAAGIYRTTDTTNARDRQQIENGIRLGEGVYLRRFPVWGDFRGNLGVLLSQATAAAHAGQLLESDDLLNLARQQIEWALGRNPFAQSLMYGVGHDYAPQYTAVSGNLTGSLPVGIQSRLDRDVPYWPAANCYNYAEVWVHPVSRFFTTAAELLD